MTTDGEPLSLRHLDDISEEEFRRRTDAPLTSEEIDETAALVAWFTRRYPTPRARLRYVRRKYREWTRAARVAAVD